MLLILSLAEKHASLCLGSRGIERSLVGVMAYDPTKPWVIIYQKPHPTTSPIRNIFEHPHLAAHTQLPAGSCTCSNMSAPRSAYRPLYTKEGFVYAARCIENRSRTWLSGCWNLPPKFACRWRGTLRVRPFICPPALLREDQSRQSPGDGEGSIFQST